MGSSVLGVCVHICGHAGGGMGDAYGAAAPAEGIGRRGERHWNGEVSEPACAFCWLVAEPNTPQPPPRPMPACERSKFTSDGSTGAVVLWGGRVGGRKNNIPSPLLASASEMRLRRWCRVARTANRREQRASEGKQKPSSFGSIDPADLKIPKWAKNGLPFPPKPHGGHGVSIGESTKRVVGPFGRSIRSPGRSKGWRDRWLDSVGGESSRIIAHRRCLLLWWRAFRRRERPPTREQSSSSRCLHRRQARRIRIDVASKGSRLSPQSTNQSTRLGSPPRSVDCRSSSCWTAAAVGKRKQQKQQQEARRQASTRVHTDSPCFLPHIHPSPIPPHAKTHNPSNTTDHEDIKITTPPAAAARFPHTPRQGHTTQPPPPLTVGPPTPPRAPCLTD